MDTLAHYHMYDYRARSVVAITTDIVREAQRRHGLDPLTTIAVGRAISCAAVLASTLKGGREYVHCLFAGEGPLAKVIAECNGEGHCRGYSVPARILEALPPGSAVPGSVGEAVGGRGVLTVSRGLPGEMSGPYNAVCALQNGEIAADVARYLTDSEQIPSAVAAGVKLSSEGEVLAAGGVLVQQLGGQVLPETALSELEERMSSGLSLSDRIANGDTPDAIVAYLQGQGEGCGWGLLSTRALVFRCTCSRQRMADALTALGEEQLVAIQRDVGKIEMRCQYCGEDHRFRLAELIQH